jgi:hypothetical protein
VARAAKANGAPKPAAAKPRTSRSRPHATVSGATV